MSDKYRILFIINPISGIGQQRVIPELVKEVLDHDQFEPLIEYSDQAGHAIEITKQAVADGFDMVCAVGGDGSVNEVASALVHTNTALAIIPAGSGNGLARQLNIPMKPVNAMRRINKLNRSQIDTGLLNDRFFVGTAGIGFDAHIALEFDRSGRRGALNYFRMTLKEFFSYDPITYRITTKHGTVDKKALLITIANSEQWGNNAKVAPGARLDDGLLRLCVLKPFKAWQAPRIALKLFRGTLKTSRLYEQIVADSARIEHAAGPGHVDGEPMEIGEIAEIAVQHSSLFVIH